MTFLKPLPAEALYIRCDPDQFTFQTTAELEAPEGILGQERAIEAMELGIRIRGDSFNVFAMGPAGLGKMTTIQKLVQVEAARQPVPPDWCYVNNFAQPHKPQALRLPAGHGARLQRDMTQLIEDLGNAIPSAFEGEEYRTRREEIEEEFKERQTDPLNELREEAKQDRIVLFETPTGFALAPIDNNDEVLSPAQFNELPEEDKSRIQKAVERLQQRLQKILRQFPVWRKETREKVKNLNREVARLAVSHLIDAIQEQYQGLPDVLRYLEVVRQDIVDNVEEFLPQGESQPPFIFGPAARAAPFERYKVNLLVDHGGHSAAPVICEDLPNHANLLGRVEYQAQMGTLVTDFTMIKPGALHRANGGYLILDARKVLLQPYAWESLKRILQSCEIRIESLERTLSLVSTASLEPEPIPLDLKVVLTGERLLYYLLSDYDPEFKDLFKVAADFEESLQRSQDNHLHYAQMLGMLAREKGLRPLDRGAVARMIEHGARLAEDAEKLSAHLRSLTDLLREANHWSGEAGTAAITAADVQKAIDKQIYRSDRIRQRTLESIQRGTLLIQTTGEVIGQANGLSVVDLGDFAFGRPTRITATTRLGEGDVLDIERETELGGAIHSKGVLILSNFLAARYAPASPLSVNASLVFEQSYGEVEGDSASLAELCALLSSLSGLPIRQSLAVTGSINQHGQVQPIGGVNEKIEGFFDVCKGFGLNGGQGVVIPASNVKHLMLRHDVVEAASRDQFHVYAVESVDEALELLTGCPAGTRDGEGLFPDESVNGRVEKRLIELTAIRHTFEHGAEQKGEDGKVS